LSAPPGTAHPRPARLPPRIGCRVPARASRVALSPVSPGGSGPHPLGPQPARGRERRGPGAEAVSPRSGRNGPEDYNPAVERRGREHERTEEERAQVAEELRRVREQVRERAFHERDPASVLGEPRALPTPEPIPREPAPVAEPASPRPDASAVNAAWRAEAPPGPG